MAKKKLIKYQVLWMGDEYDEWGDYQGKECAWILAENKKQIRACFGEPCELEIRTEAEVLKVIEKNRKLAIKEFKLAQFRTIRELGWDGKDYH
jgi:hypothetical protein